MIYSAQNDDRLARLAGEGNRSAFAEIFQRYHQPLYRYCQGVLGSQDDALDALQATMEQAWRSVAKQRVHGGLRAWLYRIAHNESVSLLRTRERQGAMDVAPEALEQFGDAAGEAAQRERIRELVVDLRSLPERQRGALLMRELSGLDYDQVAAALAISPAAARQAVYEARTALHSLVEGRDMDCQDVRRKVSDGDGRAIRGRRLRAHLSACAGCRAFKDGISTRPAQLALAFPVLPAGASGSVLSSLVAPGGGGGTTGGGAGIVRTARGRRRAALVGTVAAVAVATSVVMPGGEKPSRDSAARTVDPAPAPAVSKRRAPRPHRPRATPPRPSPAGASSAVIGYSAVPGSVIAAGQQPYGAERGAAGPGARGAGADTGGLPFTGMEAGLMALLGLTLVGVGVLLRRLSTHRQPG